MAAAKVICDTDVMIDYLNSNSERYLITKNLIENSIGTENVILSAITKMELIIGATNKNMALLNWDRFYIFGIKKHGLSKVQKA